MIKMTIVMLQKDRMIIKLARHLSQITTLFSSITDMFISSCDDHQPLKPNLHSYISILNFFINFPFFLHFDLDPFYLFILCLSRLILLQFTVICNRFLRPDSSVIGRKEFFYAFISRSSTFTNDDSRLY